MTCLYLWFISTYNYLLVNDLITDWCKFCFPGVIRIKSLSEPYNENKILSINNSFRPAFVPEFNIPYKWTTLRLEPGLLPGVQTMLLFSHLGFDSLSGVFTDWKKLKSILRDNKCKYIYESLELIFIIEKKYVQERCIIYFVFFRNRTKEIFPKNRG